MIISHPTLQNTWLFPNALGTFSKIDHRLGHKTSFNKFQKIEIIQRMLCTHSGIKLEIITFSLGNLPIFEKCIKEEITQTITD